MYYDEQRKLALRLFGDLGEDVREVLKDERKCYEDIFMVLKKYKKQVFKRIEKVKIPSEWAYRWAYWFGDKDVMRDRIMESRWAYWWAKNIGDKEIMRDKVTESKWAYLWAYWIGDREIMRDRVVESKWADEWAYTIGNKEIMKRRKDNVL